MGAVSGDFLESFIKRVGMVKDSGIIFPGHGGMIDRVYYIYTYIFIIHIYIFILYQYININI